MVQTRGPEVSVLTVGPVKQWRANRFEGVCVHRGLILSVCNNMRIAEWAPYSLTLRHACWHPERQQSILCTVREKN